MAGEKVLLVDDEEDFINTLSERMELKGIKTFTASTGTEALEMAGRENFDAVVLDMIMPGIDGIETLRRLLEKNPKLQVILLTGHATIQKGVEALKLGAYDFLQKPVNLQLLLEKIKAAKAERMLLVSEAMEGEIKDILKSKGW